MIVWNEARGEGGERARGRGPRREGRRGGKCGLKKDRESKNEEEKRGVEESAWSNPGPEGSLDG